MAALSLDRLVLVPCARSPHKPEGPVADGEDRFAMLVLAARGMERVEVDDLELMRPPPSYTVDTLREFRARDGGAALHLLLGADALADFPRWRSAAEIVTLCRVVPFARPGTALPPRSALAANLGEEAADRILAGAVHAATPDVSSSEVRRRLAAGEAVGDALPPAVETYIRHRGLYLPAETP